LAFDSGCQPEDPPHQFGESETSLVVDDHYLVRAPGGNRLKPLDDR
jgi:hypothetical protein